MVTVVGIVCAHNRHVYKHVYRRHRHPLAWASCHGHHLKTSRSDRIKKLHVRFRLTKKIAASDDHLLCQKHFLDVYVQPESTTVNDHLLTLPCRTALHSGSFHVSKTRMASEPSPNHKVATPVRMARVWLMCLLQKRRCMVGRKPVQHQQSGRSHRYSAVTGQSQAWQHMHCAV